MKIKLPIALIALMLPAVLYAAPPVDVEIADEEAKDFFSSEPEEEEEGVKKNADDAFEELEATEKGAKIKRKKRARSEGDDSDDNSNINQNVVNVMVVTGDKDTKAEAKADSKVDVKAEQPAAPVVQPVEVPVHKDSAPKAEPVVQANSSQFYGHNTWKSWWEKEPGIGDGDVLFFATSGGYGGGLYLGLGFEGMFSDWGGIRLTVNGAGFNQHAGRYDRGDDQLFFVNNGDWDFFLGGKTVAPTPEKGTVGQAIMHLEDLSFTLHFGGDSGLDLYPSLGVSHFGYHLDTNGQDFSGGSVFMRAGAGLQYVYKRFFAGVDLGWYPVELARYGIVDTARGEQARAKRIDDPFDSRRVTFSAHLGLAL